MKKGIILLVLIFTACVNLEDTGSNSGGEVKEIKRTDINVSKNYEKRNGILYIDNILFIFPPNFNFIYDYIIRLYHKILIFINFSS